MIEKLTRRQSIPCFGKTSSFAARYFRNLNPQAGLAMNWHLEVIAAKLTAARRAGRRNFAQTVN